MRALDGTGHAKRLARGRSRGARRGPLAAALTALLMLGCLLGLAATASAAPLDSSAEALLARLALQQSELTAAAGAAADIFGSSVAISGDTALVGAPLHDTAGAADAGAAYVFVRSAGSWTQQAKLTAADGAAHDSFGYSVALSGDTALVGASRHDTAGLADAGAAYVFTRSGGSWTQQAQLTAGAAGDIFGGSVALSGETALVGAVRHDSGGAADAGAAYVFTRSAGSWTQQALLIADAGAAGDMFGNSVALSGETALVGARFHDTVGKADAGAAYVFTRSGDSWTLQPTLIAADGSADDQFGYSVALSGAEALVGARFHDTGGQAEAGAAYVFTRSAGSWTPQQTLTAAAGSAGDSFGTSVALSGATALVGAPTHDNAGQADAGAAYIFLSVPAITKLLPASGKRGALVTISGSGFGAARGANSVKFGTRKCTTYLSWSAAQIKCRVPATAKIGKVKVTVTTAAAVSNAKSFTVKR